jgi:hypothetical protein
MKYNWIERFFFWLTGYKPWPLAKFRCRSCGHFAEGHWESIMHDRQMHSLRCQAPGCIWVEDERSA